MIELSNIPFLVLNNIIVLGSLFLIVLTVIHYMFFAKSIESKLAGRVKHIFLADLIGAFSVLSFNIAVFYTGSYDAYYEQYNLRVSLKILQAFAVFFTIFASWRLHSYYKEIK